MYEWHVTTHTDDFTDEVLAVIANTATEELDAFFAIACNRTLATATITISNDQLARSFLGVRWRIDNLPAHEDKAEDYLWLRRENFAVKALANNNIDPLDTDSLVRSIMEAPPESESMIFEISDGQGNKQRGRITLVGARESIQQVLDTCQGPQ